MVVGDFPIETETLVIGAGPGGYVAAIRAAQLGQKVTIVEKGDLGGVCLNVGCIPSKALISASQKYDTVKNATDIGITADNVTVDFPKVQQWKSSVIKRLTDGVEGLLKGNKIEIVRGEAYFVDENTVRVMDEKSAQTYKFQHAIIATGSRPIDLFPRSNRVLDSTGALSLQEIPNRLVVIGGGYIGTELGNAYANFGTKVTILEGGKDILLGFEKQMSTFVKRSLKKKGAQIVTQALAKSIVDEGDKVIVTYETKGEEKQVEADYVLVTVGRKPNTDELGLEQINLQLTEKGLIQTDEQCRTNIANIFAIGDIVTGPPLAHKASYEGKIAAEVIAGKHAAIDYMAIPEVVFTDPELATIGYTEKEAKAEGIEVVVAKFPFAANGRALSMNDTDGFLKLVMRKEDNLLIGGQIAGSGASDLVAEIGLAIEAGMTAEDVALTIHAHPTLSEVTMEAAEIALGTPTHIMK